MIIQFKNREKELIELKEVLGSEKFELFITYGRRRIGKTELILNATKKKKRIYYLATTENNLERFYNVCLKHDKKIADLKKDFEVLFDYIKDKYDVVIIDEFQNLIKENENYLNIFQSIVDTKLKNSKLKLFLLGSSVSMMTSKVLSYKSPLYGRRTGSLNLKAVSFFDLIKFFPKSNAKKLIEIFGFADGIPFYLVRIDQDFWSWLNKELTKQRTYLKDEVDFLVRYEFDDPSTYKLILEAIAKNNTKLNEIKNFIKVKRTDISPYLKNLIEIGLVKRIVPITENIKSRKGRYYISDNFLKFWFKYIYPNLSSIEEGIFNINIIKKDYDNYLGFIFEDVAKQFIVNKKIIDFQKIGKWWHKDKEIDVIALDNNKKEILLCECKWKSKINALKICKELNEKSKYVQWNNNKRKEYYAI
ncbi:MAG: ATP-binding protein, partial [Candidatus Aenigmarchaeota archaeon]|nr:ATP-binding protein [Candidatus Aenigmarchaeota archaeon]